MRDQTVLVAFDVIASSHEEAARLICTRLATSDLLESATRTVGAASEIEAWFLPEARDKHIDRNDRDAIAWTWVQPGAYDPLRMAWPDDEADERRPQQITRDRLRLLRRRLHDRREEPLGLLQ